MVQFLIKKITVLTVLLLSVVAHSVTNTQGADATVLNGTWLGTYNCPEGQGLTGLTLLLLGAPDGSVDAVFEFYEVPENPGWPSGSFNMTGTYDASRQLVLAATEDDW